MSQVRTTSKASAVPVDPRALRFNQAVDHAVGQGARGLDRLKQRLRVGGRAADYDDHAYCFEGGTGDGLRRKHYDKSLRLLWKAEEHAPWSDFRDLTRAERQLQSMALRALGEEERVERARINSADFRRLLADSYTLEERRALVRILSAIGHGEAYAWLVAAETLREVKSTGAKAAVTMQVLEEAKHFVVLRELVAAFEVEVPPLCGWEYVLLERVLKAEGLDKFFGMNVVVEGIALSLFGLLSGLPGLEILRQFHLDEARHAALPGNYLQEFPLSARERRSPLRRAQRLHLVAPAIPLVLYLEEPAAVLGIDAFVLGGSILRKITQLSERLGFDLPVPYPVLRTHLNGLFNGYCFATRPGHAWTDFLGADTTTGEAELAAEREVFGP